MLMETGKSPLSFHRCYIELRGNHEIIRTTIKKACHIIPYDMSLTPRYLV